MRYFIERIERNYTFTIEQLFHDFQKLHDIYVLDKCLFYEPIVPKKFRNIYPTYQRCTNRPALHGGSGSCGVHVVKQHVCLTTGDSSTPVTDSYKNILLSLTYQHLYWWELVQVLSLTGFNNRSHSILKVCKSH